MRHRQSVVMRCVRYTFGGLYVLAGLAKAFPQIEDVPSVLREAAVNNAGTILEPASRWLADHAGLMTVVVGLALFASGVCYLLNRLIVPAAAGQLLMMACFITILFNTTPMIVLIDLPFIIVAAALIYDAQRRRGDAPDTAAAAQVGL